MKWIVMWIVVSSNIVPCPTPEPACNKFGICADITTSDLTMCFTESRKNMQQEFGTKKEADEFIGEMKIYKCDSLIMTGDSCITDIKVEQQ